jgi:hypothetical protein
VLHALVRDVAHWEHGHSDRDLLRLDDLREVVAEVELRQHDYRVCAAVPGRRQVALETPRVEVAVEAADEQDGVDVRDEDVLLGFQPRCLARDLRPARKDSLDRGSTARRVANGNPIADGRHAARQLVVAQPPPRARKAIVTVAAHVVAAAVLGNDTSGLEATLCIDCEGRLELVGPADGGQGSFGQGCAPSLGRELWPRLAADREVLGGWYEGPSLRPLSGRL